jgi:hypothetical protein
MELVISRINSITILKRMIMEYSVIMGLDTKWQEIWTGGGL